jgi:hypothetical protein
MAHSNATVTVIDKATIEQRGAQTTKEALERACCAGIICLAWCLVLSPSHGYLADLCP